jgi:hypothetical protein
MWRLGLTPDWFREIDTAFEAVSILVTFLIAAAAYKFYTLTKEKKYLWFSVSFFMISISYIFKILTNIIVYNEYGLGREVLGKYTLTYQYVQEYYYFEIFGTLAFRFAMLLGLFGLYHLICKCKDIKSIPIIIFLLFLMTIFSNIQYFAFHGTAALFLGVIVWHYYQTSKATKQSFQRVGPPLAFAILFLSQLIFSLLFLTPHIYVIAETVQLLGFLVLLYAYFQLWKTVAVQ